MESPTGSRQIAELLDRHGASLELYAAQWTVAPADCVQEAFIQLAVQIQQPGGLPTNPAAWLYRVVRNHALNAARAQRRRDHYERVAARLAEGKQGQHPQDADDLPLPEALDTLPADLREIVVLRIWSQLTWQEIADITQSSSSSAQRRYVAALTRLRQQLESSCLTELP